MVVVVHAANIFDGIRAETVLKRLVGKFYRLEKILANGSYRGEELKQKVKALLGCQIEFVLRPDQRPKRFAVIPKRWIVERSFARLENYRRIAMDYEFYSESSEAMLQIVCSQIMFKRLSQ